MYVTASFWVHIVNTSFRFASFRQNATAKYSAFLEAGAALGTNKQGSMGV
jgi:hypothetical protein